MSKERRYDDLGNVLLIGESQRKDGRYMYRWTENGIEKSIYSLSLSELRKKAKEVNPALNIRTTPFDDCTTECLNIAYDILKDYSKKATAIMEEEVKGYKEFISFFESELPDVYRALMKEYIERKRKNEQ